jgi:hypothetical protein
VKKDEKENYEKLFEYLKNNNGMINGKKVKGVLMESKLKVDKIGKIWDMEEMDKDGMMERNEFMVEMNIV